MKKFIFSVLFTIVLAACNEGADKSGENVGDAMRQDPTTGQPLTTQPDTVGPGAGDTTNLNRNK